MTTTNPCTDSFNWYSIYWIYDTTPSSGDWYVRQFI